MRRAARTHHSRISFEASEYAKDKGLFEGFHDACYKSFWEDSADLGDMSVLEELAKGAGLDPAEMRQEVEAGTYTDRAQAQYDEAIQLGVRGIPSFIIGRYFFSGAQPYEVFKNVAERAQTEQSGIILPS